jgi:type IV pilus assembly protein PilA
MKNKGFTLIELMAVIVILALVLIIIVPEVGSIVNDNKKESFIDNARMMAKAADSYYTLHLGERPQEINASSTVELDVLVKEDLIDMVKDPFNDNEPCDRENSFVTITYLGNRKYNYYVTLDCNGYGISNVLSSDISIGDLGDL